MSSFEFTVVGMAMMDPSSPLFALSHAAMVRRQVSGIGSTMSSLAAAGQPASRFGLFGSSDACRGMLGECVYTTEMLNGRDYDLRTS